MNVSVPDEIRRITARVVEKYGPERIILFGGATRGEMQGNSDVDFLIIKRDCPLIGRERIRELHRLIDRNVPVDLLVYRPGELETRLTMGDPFLKAILRDGKVLYG